VLVDEVELLAAEEADGQAEDARVHAVLFGAGEREFPNKKSPTHEGPGKMFGGLMSR